MTTKTKLRAGGLSTNHNEKLAARTKVKAGGLADNHNQTVIVH